MNTIVGEMPLEIFADYCADCLGIDFPLEYLLSNYYGDDCWYPNSDEISQGDGDGFGEGYGTGDHFGHGEGYGYNSFVSSGCGNTYDFGDGYNSEEC